MCWDAYGSGAPRATRELAAIFSSAARSRRNPVTVLFIGLAALAATRRSHVVRALAAALLTAAVALLLPDLRMLAPVVAGVVVALPGGDR